MSEAPDFYKHPAYQKVSRRRRVGTRTAGSLGTWGPSVEGWHWSLRLGQRWWSMSWRKGRQGYQRSGATWMMDWSEDPLTYYLFDLRNPVGPHWVPVDKDN